MRVISKRWEKKRPTRPKYAIAGPLYLVGASPDCPPLQTTSEGTLGLRAGQSYTVEAVQSTRTFVGVFVKVTLRDEAGMYEVVNAHLVLEDDV